MVRNSLWDSCRSRISLFPLQSLPENFIETEFKGLPSRYPTTSNSDSRWSRLFRCSDQWSGLISDYEIFKSQEMFMEWCLKMFTRQQAAALASILGLESDQVMACGDEANDLSMIQCGLDCVPWAMRFVVKEDCNAAMTQWPRCHHGRLKLCVKRVNKWDYLIVYLERRNWKVLPSWKKWRKDAEVEETVKRGAGGYLKWQGRQKKSLIWAYYPELQSAATQLFQP